MIILTFIYNLLLTWLFLIVCRFHSFIPMLLLLLLLLPIFNHTNNETTTQLVCCAQLKLEPLNSFVRFWIKDLELSLAQSASASKKKTMHHHIKCFVICWIFNLVFAAMASLRRHLLYINYSMHMEILRLLRWLMTNDYSHCMNLSLSLSVSFCCSFVRWHTRKLSACYKFGNEKADASEWNKCQVIISDRISCS